MEVRVLAQLVCKYHVASCPLGDTPSSPRCPPSFPPLPPPPVPLLCTRNMYFILYPPFPLVMILHLLYLPIFGYRNARSKFITNRERAYFERVKVRVRREKWKPCEGQACDQVSRATVVYTGGSDEHPVLLSFYLNFQFLWEKCDFIIVSVESPLFLWFLTSHCYYEHYPLGLF